MVCNNVVDQTELRRMVFHVMQRLVLYLAAFMAGLLPLEAAYAANGSTLVAAMTDHGGDCGDCMHDERPQCQSYCLALCQSLPASRFSTLEDRELSSLAFLPLIAKFPPLINGGPEPPPPRFLH